MITLTKNMLSFLSGIGAAGLTAGAAYLVCDSVSEIITLRQCQKAVLPLALQHSALCGELGVPLTVGSLLSSSMRVSPSGQLVQCQFAIEGSKRSSDVTATVQRPPYSSSFVYNVFGPARWQLVNCHVLVSGTDTLVRSVNLLRLEEQQKESDTPVRLPAHLFRHVHQTTTGDSSKIAADASKDS